MNHFLFNATRFYMLIGVLFISIQVYASKTDNSKDYTKALQQFNNHEYAEALKFVNKAIAKEKSEAEYYLLRSEIYIELEQYENAVSDCYQAKSLNGNDSRINYLRAKISFVSGNYGITKMFLNKALDDVTDHGLRQKILVERGKTGLFMTDYDTAIEDFHAALQIDSTQDALLNLAHGFTLMNDNDRAKAIYKHVLTNDTACFKAHMALTELHIEDKNFAKALEYAKSACRIDDQSAVVNNYIGYIYYNMGNYPEAISYITKSLDTDPNNFNAFKNRALVYFKLNAVNKACDDLFKSMQVGYLETKKYDVLNMYKEKCELTLHKH